MPRKATSRKRLSPMRQVDVLPDNRSARLRMRFEIKGWAQMRLLSMIERGR